MNIIHCLLNIENNTIKYINIEFSRLNVGE